MHYRSFMLAISIILGFPCFVLAQDGNRQPNVDVITIPPYLEVEGRHHLVGLAGDFLYANMDVTWRNLGLWDLNAKTAAPQAKFSFENTIYDRFWTAKDFLLVATDETNLRVIRAGYSHFTSVGDIQLAIPEGQLTRKSIVTYDNQVVYSSDGRIYAYELSAAGVRALEPISGPAGEFSLCAGESLGITAIALDSGQVVFYEIRDGGIVPVRTLSVEGGFPSIDVCGSGYFIHEGFPGTAHNPSYDNMRIFYLENGDHLNEIYSGTAHSLRGVIQNGVYWSQFSGVYE